MLASLRDMLKEDLNKYVKEEGVYGVFLTVKKMAPKPGEPGTWVADE